MRLKKPWCFNYKKRPEGEKGAEAGWWKALAWVHNLDHIPNEFVQILWIVDLVKDPQPTIRLVSPALCWSRTIDFVENQIFRFA